MKKGRAVVVALCFTIISTFASAAVLVQNEANQLRAERAAAQSRAAAQRMWFDEQLRLAAHVAEPTTPVTGAFLQIGPYPGLNKTPFSCDGTDVVTVQDEDGDGQLDNNNLRIEPKVQVADRPSEHWSIRLQFQSPADRAGGRTKEDWDMFPLPHQNATPHGIGLTFGAGQFNHYRLNENPGEHNIVLKVEGDYDADGLPNVFVDECPFRVLVP